MTAPLTGVRVIEFANFAAAPSATAIMADLGAEVIKVEAIGGDPIIIIACFSPVFGALATFVIALCCFRTRARCLGQGNLL